MPAPVEPADDPGSILSSRRYSALRTSGGFGFLQPLVVGCLVYSLVGGVLMILAQPYAAEREELLRSPFFLGGHALMLVFLVAYVWRCASTGEGGRRLVKTVGLMGLLLALLLGIPIMTRQMRLLEMVLKPAYLLLGYALASGGNSVGRRKLLFQVFLTCSIVLLYFVCSSLFQGTLIFERPESVLLAKPQYQNGLMHSTEFSNVLTLVALVGLECLLLKPSSRAVRLFLRLGIGVLTFLILEMYAVGTFLSLLVLFFLTLLEFYRSRYIVGALAVAIILPVLLLRIPSVRMEVFDLADAKLNANSRLGPYQDLIQQLSVNPLGGVGYGYTAETTGTPPHHNILGVWYELGLVSLVGYLLILALACIAMYLLIVRRSHYSMIDRRVLHFGATGALFLHLKGLVHDTWFDPALFVCTGICIAFICYELPATRGGTTRRSDRFARRRFPAASQEAVDSGT